MFLSFRIYSKAFDFPVYSSVSYVKLSEVYSIDMDWMALIIAKLKIFT